jgi:hypothetical protein
MTATSPSSAAESASRTIDPDAQARCPSDGEPSARFQSDVTIDGEAVDVPLSAEEVPAEVDGHRAPEAAEMALTSQSLLGGES